MKSRFIKYLIICLAVGSIATDCAEEELDPNYKIDINVWFLIEPETGPTNSTFTFIIDVGVWGYADDDELDNDIEEFQWDFDYTGGGVYSFDTEVISEKTITHVYTEPGTYTVILKATVQDAVKYSERELIVTESTNSPPVAEFVGNPTSGTAPLTVYFTEQSDNEPTSWLWDFGNGESSTEQNPTNTYNDVGTYTVKLTATNDHGSDDEEKIDYITVTDGSNPCPGTPTVTDVDGNIYNTVWVGSALFGYQCWMKENLKTTRYNDSTEIPNVEDGIAWKDLITGAYVWYENETSWKDKYGALYNWYTVDDAKGICPTGWHVPSKDEWITMESSIGGNGNNLAQKLRSCRQVNSPLGDECNTTEHPRWDETSVIFGALDEYKLSLLPGGYRAGTSFAAYFHSIGSVGGWWTSTEDNDAWFRSMEHDAPNLYDYLGEKNQGYSVRCIKND